MDYYKFMKCEQNNNDHRVMELRYHHFSHLLII